VLRETVPVSQVDSTPSPPSGFSPFLAKVLEQLSLTAWMPSALIVANLAILLGFILADDGQSSDRELFLQVARGLDERPFGIIVALLFGLVLTTLISQSLDFSAIRFLEGYWGSSVVTAVPTAIGIHAQRLHQTLLLRRAVKLQRRAFRSALPKLEKKFANDAMLLCVAQILVRGKSATGFPAESVDRAAGLVDDPSQWLDLSSAVARHRLESVDKRLQSYPGKASRMMPTRLGCVLRTAEERFLMVSGDSDLRAAVIRRLPDTPAELLAEHDQYRNRLDLYAVMTLICFTLAAINAVILALVLEGMAWLVVTAAFAALSLASYRGALAAGRDWGDVLVEMGRRAGGEGRPGSQTRSMT
jgi:hypothetical protein